MSRANNPKKAGCHRTFWTLTIKDLPDL